MAERLSPIDGRIERLIIAHTEASTDVVQKDLPVEWAAARVKRAAVDVRDALHSKNPLMTGTMPTYLPLEPPLYLRVKDMVVVEADSSRQKKMQVRREPYVTRTVSDQQWLELIKDATLKLVSVVNARRRSRRISLIAGSVAAVAVAGGALLGGRPETPQSGSENGNANANVETFTEISETDLIEQIQQLFERAFPLETESPGEWKSIALQSQENRIASFDKVTSFIIGKGANIDSENPETFKSDPGRSILIVEESYSSGNQEIHNTKTFVINNEDQSFRKSNGEELNPYEKTTLNNNLKMVNAVIPIKE